MQTPCIRKLLQATGFTGFLLVFSTAWVGAQNVQIVEHSPKARHPTVGPADAPVTLEFFLRIDDAPSQRALNIVQVLIKRHPKRLRVIFRLTEKGKRSSSLAQNFGQEAFAQGHFFEFLDAYYAARKPSPKDYPDVAKAAGVNYKRVQQALDSMEHEVTFRENYYYWRRALVNQVPGFRFNGRNAARVRTVEQLEVLYDAAYADALELQSSGVAIADVAKRRIAADEEERFTSRRIRGTLDGAPIAARPDRPTSVSLAKLANGALVQGPDTAVVTLVFVCHFQSILCGRMSRNLDDIRKAYPDEVRIVFRPLYDPSLPGQDNAPLMHQAALCAREQSVFWEFYRHAFEKQRRINFDQTLAIELASSGVLDLNVEKFEQCLESGRHLDALDAELALVRSAGIQHTPALVINGVAYWGRLHFADIRGLLNNALRPGLLEQLGSP
ncbi:MAG: thioredoxin domain-containing protein [Myxococcales bacterium]|nr:thioredoxin domain-containing protein [Myxococcales bacterium]